MTAERRYARAPRVAHREVDGNRVLVLARSGEVVVINATGGFLWDRLADGATLDELVAALAATFAIDAEQARHDATAFLDDLVARGAVVVEAPRS